MTGSWDTPFEDTVVGVHAALLHTNQVLFWTYEDEEPVGTHGHIHGVVAHGEWSLLDLGTGKAVVKKETTERNQFCSGQSILGDGSVLVVGGDRGGLNLTPGALEGTGDPDNCRTVRLFKPKSKTWEDLPDLDPGRWYPTVATSLDAEALIIGGNHAPEWPPENIHEPTRSLQVMNESGHILHTTEFDPELLGSVYPLVFVLPKGRLFVHLLDKTRVLQHPTSAFGNAQKFVDATGSRTYGDQGTAVLLPLQPNEQYRARIMLMGGGEGNEPTPAKDSCVVLDLDQKPTFPWLSWLSWLPWLHKKPGWRLTKHPMNRRRVMPDSVLLPDGKVLVVNGSATGRSDAGKTPVYEAEVFDPATEKWTLLAKMKYERLYHSTALLLPDGRVMTAGSDREWNPGPDFDFAHTKVEVFSPPYLSAGPRPVVSNAPPSIVYGSNFVVATPDASTIDTVALLRCGSCTHSFNSDQRYVGLRVVDRSSEALTLKAPPDAFVAPPGYYMLFLVRKGVPSEAPFIRVLSPQRLYDAVWKPSGGGEIQVYGYLYDDFRAKYDELWKDNWRLHILNTYIENNQRLYDAVWKPSGGGEIQVYGYLYDDFRAKYDELWKDNWRLHILNTYIENNQRLYDAVWKPSGGGEIQVYGYLYDDFRAKYDELWKDNWRLHILNTYIENNQRLYDAVWKPSGGGEIQVYGYLYDDFRAKYDELWKDNWRLHILNTYIENNQRLYDAVWKPSGGGEIQVYGYLYDDFRAKYDELWKDGWRLHLLNPHVS